MNNCGCNNIRGPLLTENKVKSLLSENLQYHLDKDIPLFESVFRIGSNAHLKLIKEARKMYSRNIIDLCEEDEHLIKTHLGEFALYKGEAIPLDLPMLNESYDYDEIAQSEFGMDYDGKVHVESVGLQCAYELTDQIVNKVCNLFKEVEDEPTADQLNTQTVAEKVI